MTSSLNIVGISAHHHDAACCLLMDGRLVAAAEEERFSRVKHDSRLPWQAFQYCLREGGLSITDVDCVAWYENPQKKLERQIWSMLVARRPLPKLDPQRVEREIRECLGFAGRIEYTDHHLAHAASSFFYSGFNEAALMTVDGVGEWATATYGRGCGTTLDLFERVEFPHSIGLLYSTMTSYLGFAVNEAEYKVMGLAPYGRPRYRDKIHALLRSGPRGQFSLDLRYFDFSNWERMFSDELPRLFGAAPRQPESEILTFHQDVAASLQVVLEEVLLEKVRYLHEVVPVDSLCMAGGVALNCVANGRIRKSGPFKALFVQPAATDAGGALGAAAIALGRMSAGRVSCAPMTTACLGPHFSNEEIRALLAPTGLCYRDYAGKREALLRDVAQRLASGEVVGWFQGRMEFGPRALGARSILADPRRPDMRDRINASVKRRESFRPFAPAVLQERVEDHFDLDHPSPYMLETCGVRSPLGLPAVTHVDGSARVQTVDADCNPRFAALLREFERITGCPILLNTSFNLRGEPIVLSPMHALRTFSRSAIDLLVLEDFVIEHRDIPDIFVQQSELLAEEHSREEQPGAVGHAVYTFF